MTLPGKNTKKVIKMNYQFVSNPQEKAQITDCILRRLPDWFGIEEAIVEYTNTVGDTVFIAAMDQDKASASLA
jgi:hypothetical protein